MALNINNKTYITIKSKNQTDLLTKVLLIPLVALFFTTLASAQTPPSATVIVPTFDNPAFIFHVGQVVNEPLDPFTGPATDDSNRLISLALDNNSGGTGLSFSCSMADSRCTLTGSIAAIPRQGPDVTATYSFTLSGPTSTTFNIRILGADTAPVLPVLRNRTFITNRTLTPSTLPAATGGNTFTGIGADGMSGNYTYELTGLPPGLSFSPSTRVITGTPTGPDMGYRVSYTVTDVDGDTDTQTATWGVVATNSTPTYSAATATVNVLLPQSGTTFTSNRLPALSGGNAPIIYSVAPTPIPAGLRVDTSVNPAEVSVDTDQFGANTTTELIISATDLDGEMAQTTITVTRAADPLTLPATLQGSPFTFYVGQQIMPLTLPQATGGVQPYTYILAAVGTLPSGLTINGRTLSGTPTQITSSPVSFGYGVRDSRGQEVGGTFAVNIAVDSMPAFSSTTDDFSEGQNITIPDLTITSGEMVNYRMPVATGGNGALTPTVTGLPAGLTPNFSLTPPRITGSIPAVTPQTVQVTLTYTDIDGDTANATFDLIQEADLTPTISASGALTDLITNRAVVGQTFTDANWVEIDTPGNLPYTYTLTPHISPNHQLTIDSESGTVSGTLNVAIQSFRFIITVTDRDGDNASHPFTLRIERTQAPTFDGGAAVRNIILNIGDTYTSPRMHFPLATAAGGGAITYAIVLESDESIPLSDFGLAFDSDLRVLRGNLANDVVGGGAMGDNPYTQRFLYRASANGLSTDLPFTVEATDPRPIFADRNPTFFVLPGMSGTSFTLSEARGGNLPISYRLTPHNAQYGVSPTLPSGVSIDASHRVLSGAFPVSGYPLTYTYYASDNDNDRAFQTITINSAEPVSFPTIATPTHLFKVGASFSTQLTGANGGIDVTYTLLNRSDGTEFRIPGLIFVGRTLSGAPTAEALTTQGASRTHQLILRATSTISGVVSAADQNVDVTINPRLGPSLQAPANVITRVNRALSVTLPQAGGNINGTLSYELRDLPTGIGLAFDASTRVLSGPATGALRSTTLTYVVVDDEGTLSDTSDDDTDSVTFNLTVLADSALALPEIADFSVRADGRILNRTLDEATNRDGDVTYSLGITGSSSVTLPAGLSFNPATRIFTLTPADTVQNSYALTYTAIDNNRLPSEATGTDADPLDNDTATESFTLTVQAAPVTESPPRLAAQTVAFTVGDTRAVTHVLPPFENVVGRATYSLNLMGGTGLPPSFSFDAATQTLRPSGVIDAGLANEIYTLTYGVIADNGRATTTVTLRIDPQTLRAGVGVRLVLEEVIDLTARVGTPTAVVLPAATGVDGIVTYTLETLPQGLQFDSATRLLDGTPGAESVGVTTLTYTATDDESTMDDETDDDSAAQTFMLTITEALALPEIQDVQLVVNAAAHIQLPSATGAFGSVTYSLTELPSALSFSAVSRRITGTAEVIADAAVITYTATDAQQTAVRTFMLTVTELLPVLADQSYTFRVGQTVSLQLPEFESVVGMPTYSILGEPTEFSFDADTRTLSTSAPIPATLLADRTYTFTYQVVDDDGTLDNANDDDTATATITLTIIDVPPLTTVATVSVPRVSVNLSASLGVSISDRIDQVVASIDLGEVVNFDLDGHKFSLSDSGRSKRGLSVGLWYQLDDQELSETSADIKWSGTSETTNVGIDVGFGVGVSSRLVLGVVSSANENEITYSDASGDDSNSYSLSIDPTTVYASLSGDAYSVWVTAADGEGELVDTTINAPISAAYSSSVVGIKVGRALESGLRSSVKVESLSSELSFSEATDFTAMSTDTSQIRISFAIGYKFTIYEFATITPSLEFGSRELASTVRGGADVTNVVLDGGATETGFGLDLHYLEWTMGYKSRSVELNSYIAEGTSLLIRYESDSGGRGFGFSFAPTRGETASGVDQLWSAQNPFGLSSSQPSASAADDLVTNIHLGYGFEEGKSLVTPYISFVDAVTTQTNGIGVVYDFQSQSSLELSFENVKQKLLGDNTRSVSLTGRLEF